MYRTHGFIKDMDKTALLKMREEGLSNQQIANRVGCSNSSIRNLIGSQPKEMTLKNRVEGRARQAQGIRKGIVFKARQIPHPLDLEGAFLNYWISADRSNIELRDEYGVALMVVKREELGQLVTELRAIHKNIDRDVNAKAWA